jgi:V/A-type H+-transporting ATPase subunit I
MIVRMKEIWLFTRTNSVKATIQTLGQLGVLDITEIEKASNKVVQEHAQAVEDTQRVIGLLEEQKTKSIDQVAHTNPQHIVNRLLRFKDVVKELRSALESVEQQLEFYQTWGQNVQSQDVLDLLEKGIYLRLYRIPKSQLKQLSEKHILITFPEAKGRIPVALFTDDPEEKLNIQEEQIPENSFETLTNIQQRKERQLAKTEEYLADQKKYLDVLKEYLHQLQEQLNKEQALEVMDDIEGTVSYLKGYIPKQSIAKFKEVAEKEHWGYVISEPKNPDDVPVYIKNPKWISIINPMMKFIDIVPGYKEVDVSIYFLVAFALFFAMLVGDAGYGLLFLILTLLFRKKMTAQLSALIFILSGSTIVWGVLSGTYFGAEQIAQLPFLKDLVIPNMASFGVDNIGFMMHLSFLIGAIHLTIAHGVRVVKYINSIKALSEVGWIALVWGLFFITEQLVLGNPAPNWYLWLFVGGATLVILFSKESTSFLKSMGASIANLPLSLISGFSDIVSYVRLFAVGMATAAVAASFNQMSLPDGIANLGILDLTMAAIALLLGHTLNIALALMAVMVHGIRLNMLEFAGHLGVQFSGEAYNPFQLTEIKNEQHKN